MRCRSGFLRFGTWFICEESPLNESGLNRSTVKARSGCQNERNEVMRNNKGVCSLFSRWLGRAEKEQDQKGACWV